MNDGGKGEGVPGPAGAAPPPALPPAGWYADPWDGDRIRYWTGQGWAGDTLPHPEPSGGGAGGSGALPEPSGDHSWGPQAPQDPWNALQTDQTQAAWGVHAVDSPVLADPPVVAGPAFGPWGGEPPAAQPSVPEPGLGPWSTETGHGGGWGGGAGPFYGPPLAPAPASGPPEGARAGRFWALVALAALAAALVGVGIGHALAGKSASRTRNIPSATPGNQNPGTTAPAPPADPSAAAIAAVVAQPSDVTAPDTVEPIPGGSQVVGQTTLDLCNGTFPSEALRTSRLQVAEVNAQFNVVFSTEAVLYRTPAATEQAFSELRSTADKCPSTPVVSPVGEPTATTHFFTAPDSAWPQVPGVDRLAYQFETTDQSGNTQQEVAVYLRHVRALMGVNFPHPGGAQPSVAGQTTLGGIVGVFAQRLAQLPASVVNG